MTNLLKMLPVDGSGTRDWDAISVKWLTQWLANSKEDFKPVDNNLLLCPHSKLHPDSVSNAKYITQTAVSIKLLKYFYLFIFLPYYFIFVLG